MLSLATSRDSREAQDDIIATMDKAQLLTCYLHEAVQRVVLSKGPLPLKRISLTEREKECLLWAAEEGKTGWGIGNIVNISERTVTFSISERGPKNGCGQPSASYFRTFPVGLLSPALLYKCPAGQVPRCPRGRQVLL